MNIAQVRVLDELQKEAAENVRDTTLTFRIF
jgi:hypothetical protein